MLSKPSNVLLAFYRSSIPGLTHSVSGCNTSLHQRSTRAQQQRLPRQTTRAAYATIADRADGRHEEPSSGHHEWPSPPRGAPYPTPYQIFALKHNAPYSKSRFYQLVKLYHPDKSGALNDNNSPNNISHQVKTERYRLIVAAHTILSDPVKRSAYDRFGAGWNGKAEVGRDGNSKSPGQSPGPFSQSWGNPDDPIWRNATWEDWERFYAKRAQGAEGVRRERQAPVYFRNTYFLALVIAVVMMGGSLNYNRAQDVGQTFVEQRDVVHDRAAKELRKLKQDVSSRGKEERIQWFMRQREATLGLAGSDVEVMREEKAQRLLPDREVCKSDGVSDADT
ncbi:hypothetical protein MBLNU230_g1268t1 [Neophaeotheca triangularis]